MNLEQEIVLTLSEQLRFLRGYNAVKQQEIADALCIDRSTYAYYELGRNAALAADVGEAGPPL